jgi:hypothetical protein
LKYFGVDSATIFRKRNKPNDGQAALATSIPLNIIAQTQGHNDPMIVPHAT